jgi:hypothetical protein
VFAECYKGTGQACGSVYLDHAFGQWLERKLGPARSRRLLRGKRLDDALSYFENAIKQRFYPLDDSCNRGYRIALNCGEDEDDASIELEDGFLKITKSYSTYIDQG